MSEWHEQKIPMQFHRWHDDAIRSTGFQPLREYEVDTEGKPTFVEMKHPFDKDIIHQIYLENLHYYEKFLEAKSNQLIDDDRFTISETATKVDISHVSSEDGHNFRVD